MTANVGGADRVVRFLAGSVLSVAPFLFLPAIWSIDTLTLGSIIMGPVLAIVALVRYCPICGPVGLSTCKV